jgi:hypothetical protein
MSSEKKGVSLRQFFDKKQGRVDAPKTIQPKTRKHKAPKVQKGTVNVPIKAVPTPTPTGKITTPTRSDINKPPKSAEGLMKPTTYEEFIYWIATPDQYRNPSTQKQFALKWKVNEDTLTDWKRRDGFYDEVRKNVRIYGRDHLAVCTSALITNILKKGNGQDFKAFVEYVDEFNPKIRLEDAMLPVSGFTGEQLLEVNKAMKLSALDSLIKSASKKKESFVASESNDQK